MDEKILEDNATATSNDAGWFGRNSKNASNAGVTMGEGIAVNNITYNKESDFYDMSGQRHLIIFNHYKYKSTVYYNYKTYKPREGTYNDVLSLQETFKSLDFHVTPRHDFEYDQIMDEISKLCKADHSNTSCVAIVILTHGENGGMLCAADRPYELSDVITMLQQAPGLAGKPKLIFVQACRGKNMDSGSRIRFDGEGNTIVIPTQADCLVVYSSIEDFLSYRDRDGSWLIQALCKAIDERREYMDLLQILTVVNRSVAFRDTYTPSNKETHLKKQMPETRFTLTKLIKF